MPMHRLPLTALTALTACLLAVLALPGCKLQAPAQAAAAAPAQTAAPAAAQAAQATASPPAADAWPAPDKVERDGPDAELMVQIGDMDNFGFGFPDGFDLFTGRSTPVHSYPFKPSETDASGTDRIMVPSGFRSASGDGYTASTSRPDNDPRPLRVAFDLDGIEVKRAALQLFVDDFQARVWGATYRVWINGTEVPVVATTLNALDQTGPIGKLVTVELLPEQIGLLREGKFELRIDDPSHDVADGYALDFVRILINPKPWRYTGTVHGIVIDEQSGAPLAGVLVSASNTAQMTTGADGNFTLSGVPAGLAVVSGSHPDYQVATEAADLVAGDDVRVVLRLKAAQKTSAGLREQLDRIGKVDIYGIHFDTDKDSLRPESDAVLGQVLDLLKQHPSLKLVIAGHTDAQGSDAHNIDLSNRRAQTVVAWLVAHGIAGERLQAEGHGESQPVASNDSAEGRALNRRVELRKADG
ncbi:OmpA family protein [Thermomonas sp.]|uniref:OmpA family protein n=1 Tax=Thermomonas sp. TaxID=1971895 RepID=UPI002D1647A2|nr:OmpA family protein [Thermomonas sp.]HRO62432.1 OmpA family protein [Thermomonas sp.]